MREETNGECPTLKTMKYLAKEPLLFEPGYRWEFSLYHDVLAALVEAVTGMTFGEYVKKNIFDVMEQSTFNLPDNELDRLCPQFRLTKWFLWLQRIKFQVLRYNDGLYPTTFLNCVEKWCESEKLSFSAISSIRISVVLSIIIARRIFDSRIYLCGVIP